MTRNILILLTMLTAACTSTADIQRACADLTYTFMDEVACFENQVAQDSYLSGDSFVQEYVLASKVLAEKVAAGQLTDNEARLQLAREYNNLVLRQQQYHAYNAIAFENLRPRHTTCHESGGTLVCDTY